MCNAPLSHSFLELHNEDILDLLSSAPTTDSTSNREDRRELLQLRENMQGEVSMRYTVHRSWGLYWPEEHCRGLLQGTVVVAMLHFDAL
jgi:hypothetical protein